MTPMTDTSSKEKVAAVEKALENDEPCKAKDLLGNMSYEEIRDTLKAVKDHNQKQRDQGIQLPTISVVESPILKPTPAFPQSIHVFSSLHPHRDELYVTHTFDNKTSILCPKK